jgi:glycosyltransferase involved in cell wall biosynthesis
MILRAAILTTVHSALDVRIFYKQAVSLAQAGHEVTLYAPAQPEAAGILAKHGIRYVSLGRAASRLGRARLWWRLMRSLRTTSYDIWHFHDPELLPLTIIWKWLFARQVRLIYDVHEDLPKDILDKQWIAVPTRKIISVLADKVEAWGMRHCQMVVAATDSIGEHVAASTDRYTIVHNYSLVNETGALERNQASDRPIRVIYASAALTDLRGVRQVVEAMKLLGDEKVELLLLGDFYPAGFEREIRDLARSNVLFQCRVPFTEVNHYLSKSDIGMINFLPLENHKEAMPNKIFEYMQAGLPIIASDFPLWREIIEDAECGLLVDPTDPIQIAAAIRTLVNQPELRHRMSQAAVIVAREHFSWQQESKKLLAIYENL